jgi:hypothetical protein
MRRLAVPLALLVMAAVPAEASADIHFRGKTGQNRVTTLRTGDDGLVERFAIRWRAPCERPHYFFTEGTQTTPASPFEEHTRNRFVDVGGYRKRLGDGLRAVFRARTVGNRVSENRWRGVFRIRVRVLRGDRLIDRCHVGTRWRVLRRG